MEHWSRRIPDCATYSPRLAALVDGELPLSEQRELEVHLRQCPRCAADVAQQRAVRRTLRQVRPALVASPILRARVQASLTHTDSEHSRWRHVVLIGSLAAVLALLVVGGWLHMASRATSAALLTRTVTAHQQETLGEAPVNFGFADREAVTGWIRSHTGADLELPSFDRAGYQLLGARLEPAVAPHAVTLVYEGAGGRLTCTLVPSPLPAIVRLVVPGANEPTHASRLQGTTVTSWGDRDTTYVLAADLEPGTLLQLAQLASKTE